MIMPPPHPAQEYPLSFPLFFICPAQSASTFRPCVFRLPPSARPPTKPDAATPPPGQHALVISRPAGCASLRRLSPSAPVLRPLNDSTARIPPRNALCSRFVCFPTRRCARHRALSRSGGASLQLRSPAIQGDLARRPTTRPQHYRSPIAALSRSLQRRVVSAHVMPTVPHCRAPSSPACQSSARSKRVSIANN